MTDQHGDEQTPSPQTVAAWLVLGMAPTEQIPWWAAQWLADGQDGQALRELAGLDGSDPRAIGDLVPLALAEMDVPLPSTDLAAAQHMFRRIARLCVSGQGSERWVAQKVEEILARSEYDSAIIALPLGQLYSVSDAWEEGWGPSIEELKATVRARCAEQLNAG